MKVYNSLTEIPNLKKPISLTIGMFDGVHRGHQSLLKQVAETKGTSIVLTFSNHPVSLLRPDQFESTIMSSDEKMKELEKHGIDAAIILPFSKDIAKMSYQMFLTKIHFAAPFNHLFIGEGDAFGKNREGTKQAIMAFAPELRFSTHYVPKLKVEDKVVSSTWIRQCLKEGNIEEAAMLLGKEPTFSSIPKGLVKPGEYRARVIFDGERTFQEQMIQVDEHGFNLDRDGTITLIK